MKTNTTTTPSLALPAAFLSLSESVLIDTRSRLVISTDGEAIVTHPLPDGFQNTRRIYIEEGMEAITPESGDPCTDSYDLTLLDHPPVYRIALNARKLAHLAEAMQSEIVVIELPGDPDGKPVKVLPYPGGAKTAFLMPHPTPPGLAEGLLVEAPAQTTEPAGRGKRAEEKPAKSLPPPVVTASAERKTLEIAFGGVPPKEIREALKDPAIGFRYSGRGTRRGVPANVWYGPDNPFTREKIAALLPVPVQAAA